MAGNSEPSFGNFAINIFKTSKCESFATEPNFEKSFEFDKTRLIQSKRGRNFENWLGNESVYSSFSLFGISKFLKTNDFFRFGRFSKFVLERLFLSRKIG